MALRCSDAVAIWGRVRREERVGAVAEPAVWAGPRVVAVAGVLVEAGIGAAAVVGAGYACAVVDVGFAGGSTPPR